MARIFVSSSDDGMREYRTTAIGMLQGLGHQISFVDVVGTSDQEPREWSSKAIADSDLFIAIVAWRYGHIPAADNPDHLSLMEIEYREAERLQKPILIFMLHESASRPQASTDPDDESRVRAFRERLARDRGVTFFQSREDLVSQIVEAVAWWERARAAESLEVGLEHLPLAWRLVADFKATHDLLRHLEPSALVEAVRKWESDNQMDGDLTTVQRLERARSGLEARQTNHAPSELWLAWMKATRFAATPPAVSATADTGHAGHES